MSGLGLIATEVDNSREGRITAKGAVIDANIKGLDQQGKGRLVGNAGIILDLNEGTLANGAQGLIATPGTCSCANSAWWTAAAGKFPATEASHSHTR